MIYNVLYVVFFLLVLFNVYVRGKNMLGLYEKIALKALYIIFIECM